MPPKRDSRKTVDSSAQPSKGADTLGSPSESARHLVDRESSIAPETSTISNAFTPDILERILSAQTTSISTLLSTLPSLLKTATTTGSSSQLSATPSVPSISKRVNIPVWSDDQQPLSYFTNLKRLWNVMAS